MLEETYTTPFFRRVDWGAFWTALTISFLVYFYTLAPTVTLEDSGELAVAADWLGVPHPPGYPIWTMLCWLATKIFSFVTFRGQPNPAWSVGLVSSYFFLPRGKTVSITILLAELGVAFYVYMPIVSDLRNPPMNWGYPRTWEGFKHALSRGQYEKINPTDVFSMRFIHQIGTYLSDLTLNFTIVLTLVGFLPFSTWKLRVNRFRLSALPVAALLIGLSALLYIPLFRNLVIPLPGIGGITAYKAPALFVVCLLAVGAIATVLGRLNAVARNHIFQEKARIWEKTLGILILAGVAGLYYLRLLKAILRPYQIRTTTGTQNNLNGLINLGL